MKTIQKFFHSSLHILIYSAVGIFLLIGLMRTAMLIMGRQRIHSPSEVQPASAALVLGAGLNRDGTPGVVLRDRIRTAAELYFNGRVQKILMSGDNSSIYYNEPGAMRAYALDLGVPEEDIILDGSGRRTYESCYRARDVFGLQDVIVVTQAFHLPRALFLCNNLGIESSGVTADDAEYNLRSYTYWWVREILASVNAYWDIYISPPILEYTLSNP